VQLPASYCKNQTRSQSGGPTMRGVETQSFTVCAGHPLTWCDTNGKTVRVMTARDGAILMGFPSTWALPTGSRAAQRAVGNAVCVALSKAIVLAAIAVQKGDASVPGEALAAPNPSLAPAKRRFELTHAQYRRLHRRVDGLERILSTSAAH